MNVSMYKMVVSYDDYGLPHKSEVYIKDVDLIEFLTSGYHYEPTMVYRDALRHGIQLDKLENMYYVTPSGTFNGRRETSNLNEHSGLICLDFDGKDNPDHDVEELFEYACDIPECLFAAKSISGNGVYSIVRIPKAPNQHYRSFKHLQKLYADIDITIDAACSDVARIRIPSWDDDYYHNENASLLWPTWEEKTSVKKMVKDSYYSKFLTSVGYFDLKAYCSVKEKSYGKWVGFEYGNRNNWIFGVASVAKERGLSYADTIIDLIAYADDDFTKNEIEKTVMSAFRHEKKRW